MIDTEGLFATDWDENHDSNIMLLAILLSSLILYNSKNAIDEPQLNQLSLVIMLAQRLNSFNKISDEKD